MTAAPHAAVAAGYLVLIVSGRTPHALLFDAEHRQLAALDPAGPAVHRLAQGPRLGGTEGPEWDAPLAAFAAAEREASSCIGVADVRLR